MKVQFLSLILYLFIPSFCFGQNSALVLVDMQEYFMESERQVKVPVGNKRKLEEVIKEQIAAIKIAKKNQVPIIFVEYDFSGGNGTLPRLLDEVKDYDHFFSVLKTADGVFEREVLEGDNWARRKAFNNPRFDIAEALKSWNIDSLVFVGANGGACVHQSICGALKKEFKVVSYAKGIIDFNYENFVYPYYYESKIEDDLFKQFMDRAELENYFNSCNRNLINSKKLFN